MLRTVLSQPDPGSSQPGPWKLAPICRRQKILRGPPRCGAGAGQRVVDASYGATTTAAAMCQFLPDIGADLNIVMPIARFLRRYTIRMLYNFAAEVRSSGAKTEPIALPSHSCRKDFSA
jgi:hypothetical protein